MATRGVGKRLGGLLPAPVEREAATGRCGGTALLQRKKYDVAYMYMYILYKYSKKALTLRLHYCTSVHTLQAVPVCRAIAGWRNVDSMYHKKNSYYRLGQSMGDSLEHV